MSKSNFYMTFMTFRSPLQKGLTLLILLLMVSCNDIVEPEQSNAFIKFYGGLGNQQGVDIKQTPDGGYILLGSTNSFGNGGYDLYLVKVDHMGNEEWSKTYGSPYNDFGKSVLISDTNDGYVLLGDHGFEDGNIDVYFLKVSLDGEEIFSYTFGNDTADTEEHGNEVQKTLDGGYIIVGSTTSTDRPETGPVDFYLIKTDAGGNKQWERTRGFEGSSDFGKSVIQVDADNYIVLGTTDTRENSDQGGTNIFVYKINANGDNIGNRFYGGQFNEEASVIRKTNAGYVILGTAVKNARADKDIYMLRIDEGLNELSVNFYGDVNNDIGRSVQQLQDGGFIILGSTNSFRGGAKDYDYYLLRTDELGNVLEDWQNSPRVFGGEGDDLGQKVIQINNGFALIGTSTFFEATENNVMNLIKTNEDGILIR